MVSLAHGVAEPGSNEVWLRNPDGTLSCLDLRTGTQHARSTWEGVLLAASVGIVIGWSPTDSSEHAPLVFAARREEDSVTILWRHTIELEPWVTLHDPSRFRVEATVAADRVIITIEASARYAGGAPAPPEIQAAATHDARRVITLDPATGEVLADEEAPRLPTLELNPDQFEEAVPYRSGAAWATAPWQSADWQARVKRATDTPGLVLSRRPVDGPEQSVFLTSDPAAELALTPDGTQLFVHEAGSPDWQVFDTTTGEPTAQIPFDPGTEDVTVVEDTALYVILEEHGDVRRRFVRSRDMITGEPLWSHLALEEQIAAPPPPPP